MTIDVRVRFVGDHGKYHCGSAAVTRSIVDALVPRHEVTVDPDAPFDALLVNGEGTMHHGSGGFHNKWREMVAAKEAGKPVWLVNTVWQENPADYDAVLRELDGVVVREELSRRDLAERHGVESRVVLDLSYVADLDREVDVRDDAGRDGELVSDFYSPEFRCFVRVRGGRFARPGFVDMKEATWTDVVERLARAELFITGRHHGVYAACRARTSFAALPGNTHKIEGLLVTAGIDIPMAERYSDLERVVRWARENRAAYEDLFDWMDAQPTWEGIG